MQIRGVPGDNVQPARTHSRVASWLLLRRVILAVVIAVGLPLAMQTQVEATTLKYRAYLVAKAQLGDKYQYLARGPDRFDCSGLTWYSYKLAGRVIKRTAQGQYSYSRHISSTSRQVGDLVFFSRAGAVRHVGIYAGRGYMIHANAGSYYGRKVIRERIIGWWSRNYGVLYGVVR